MSSEKPDSRRIIDNVTKRLVNGGMDPDKAREIAIRTRRRAEGDTAPCVQKQPREGDK